MSRQPRDQAELGSCWTDLVEELDRWGAAGRIATLWWRDDDATSPSAYLADLLRLAGDTPIGLAVIPGLARHELAGMLPPNAMVLQHGWLHTNHAVIGKKCEFPAGRAASVVAAEIGAGAARLRGLFGARAVPIFVPPWNRIGAEFIPLMRGLGLTKVSGMAPRHRPSEPVSLMTLDVHVDLTAWKQDRRFVGTEQALGAIVQRLRQSRLGERGHEPLGVLTHHLVMDDATRAFLDRLLEITRSHAALHWASPAELLT